MKEVALLATTAGRNLITWVGGKRSLRKAIAAHAPSNIESYIEPFGGAGWVMFHKERWAPLEVYNDLDGRLVNLFRVVKYHPDALRDELRLMLHSREVFMQTKNHPGITDIQRAASFCYLLNRSFGGKGGQYGRSLKGSPSGKNPDSILELIEPINKRLNTVRIEHDHYANIIKDYDHEGAFFYCDPPYFSSQRTNASTYASLDGGAFDHEHLRDTLARTRGRWLLSYDDTPEVRALYANHHTLSLERQNGINGASNTRYAELLIANYPLETHDA